MFHTPGGLVWFPRLTNEGSYFAGQGGTPIAAAKMSGSVEHLGLAFQRALEIKGVPVTGGSTERSALGEVHLGQTSYLRS